MKGTPVTWRTLWRESIRVELAVRPIRAICPTIKPAVDLMTTTVQSTVGAIAASIHAVVDSIALAIESVG